ncbi:hypothetical protein J1N35_040515 [Gossypium stocksii]|uniref:Zinc knuckle CX2CX4HX4C domain-containing protein n=1 Tax=Gossypium stocksii TaxID=47602 RepID=A0A9D3ZIE2_9ROSI|nr:hypothetical protein J1N35_040515 [Gossypium stocksii]
MESSGRSIENDLANLTLEDNEDEILAVSSDTDVTNEVHELSLGLFSKRIARQLGDFVAIFIGYDTKSLEQGFINYIQIRVLIDVRRLLKRKKRLMFSSCISSYVNFKYERLTLFCFYCACLGHSDLSYQIRMESEMDVVGIGWDWFIQAQSRRPLAMNIIWLKGKGGK